MEALHDLSVSLDESIAAKHHRRHHHARDEEEEVSEESDFQDDEDEVDDAPELFREVRRHGHSGSTQQRQLYAILEAVSGVLDEQKQAPTPTAYFAVLMTALSSPQSLANAAPAPAREGRQGRKGGSRAKQAAEAEDDTPSVASALLHLLHLVLPEVSAGVLQAKFGEISGVFNTILSSHYHQTSTIRPLVQCIGIVIKAQEGGAWRTGGPALALLQKLLSLAVDSRPKIRQAALAALAGLYSRPSPLPASTATAAHNFCGDILARASVDDEDHRSTLYALRLLHAILPHLPAHVVGDFANRLLVLLTFNDALVTLHTLQTLQQAFEGAVTVQDASAVLRELVGVQPSHTETEAAVEFAALLRAALVKLRGLDKASCTRVLPTAVQLLTNYLACDNQEVVRASAQAMKEAIAGCVDREMVAFTASLEAIVATLVAALGPSHAASHNLVLEAIAVLAQKVGGAGEASLRLLRPVVLGLDELHFRGVEGRAAEVAQSTAWRAVIRALGPRDVLALVPLNLSQSATDRSRSWLVSELHQGVRYAPLSYFFTQIVPLAAELGQRAQAAHAQGQTRDAAELNLLATQLWNLFGAFCTLPTDLPAVFDSKAKMLGAALTDTGPETRRNEVCEGLETLITHLLAYREYLTRKAAAAEAGGEAEAEEGESAKSDKSDDLWSGKRKTKGQVYDDCPLTAADVQAGLSVVAKYARNFLPCLFNLFGSPVSPSLRATVANTIAAFLEIAPSELVNTFFKNVIQKLLESITTAATAEAEARKASIHKDKAKIEVDDEEEEEGDNEKDKSKKKETTAATSRNLLIDLVVVFVRYLSAESLDFLWKVIGAQLQKGGADARGEKRFYKVVKEMIQRHPAWGAANAQALHTQLTAGLAKAGAAGKKARLRCVAALVRAIPTERADLVGQVAAAVTGEVMLCTKEINSVTRELAFNTLTLLADRMAGPDAQDKDPMPFFKVAVAGLAGTTTHMISATINSLAHLVHHFRAELARDDRTQLVGDLVGAIVLLLAMQARPVAKAALGFLKAALTALPPASLEAHLPGIVQGVMGWLSTTDPQTQRFRAKVKILLERLIRKYSYEQIQALVPPHHHPLLHAVKKHLAEKKKAAKAATKKPAKSSSDSAGAEDLRAPKAGKTWIMDAAADEPIDFTNPSHIQHVTSRNPRQRTNTRVKQDEGFELDAEGRMVIEDPDDEEEVKAKKKRGLKRQAGDALAEGNGMDEDAENGSRGSRKRAANSDEEEEEEDAEAEQQKQRGQARRAQATGHGPNKKHKKDASAEQHTGDRYRASKAGGDQKKGKLEPYAYLPLNPASLNKRTKRKAVGQWRGVVRAAQAGAQKGAKGKKRT